MKTEKVTISTGKEFEVSELKYKDITGLADADKEKSAKILMQKATQMTDEEYDDLSMGDGVKIMGVVNRINGFTGADFQQTAIPKD